MAKIYQLYYTRLGKQESNAGWQVVSTSDGTPQLVKNTFYKLASNLVSISGRSQVPSAAFDLQTMDHYVFLSHINYYSTNEGMETDIRGVSFVHGFAVRAEEYRELIYYPEQILEIKEERIVLNYNGIKNLPILEILPYNIFSREELLSKYQLDEDRFNALMYCVYAAIGTVGGTMVIRSSKYHGEKLKTLFQEMTCLIMRSMPYILRMKISAFSGVRQGVLLCYAQELPEQGIWFDLDTGKHCCPQLPEYEFIELFNNFSLTEEQRIRYYDLLEEFVNVTYGGNYEAVKLNHVELAYRGIFFVPNWELRKEELDEYIKEAVSLKAFRYDKLDEYYVKLINRYLMDNRKFPSPEVLKKLQKRYVETENQEFKDRFAEYYTKEVCQPGEISAYEMLYRLERLKPEGYKILLGKLQTTKPEFISAYYIDYYIEQQINNYESLEHVCKNNAGSLDGPIGTKLLEIMRKMFGKELKTAENNTQRYQICQKYTEFCWIFPPAFDRQITDYEQLFKNEYWKRFQENEFSYRNQQEYADMGAGKEKNFIIPETVTLLLEVQKKLFLNPNIHNFQRVFFTKEVIDDEKIRKRLIKELHEEARAHKYLPLDSILLLNYQSGKKFDLNQIVRDLLDNPHLQGEELIQSMENSQILIEGSEAETKMIEQLKAEVKNQDCHVIIKELYEVYFPPMSSEERNEYMADLVQKYLMFLAVSLTFVILVKYLLIQDFTLGILCAVISAAVSIGGFVQIFLYGNTNSIELFVKKDKGAIIWTCIFIVLSLMIIAAAFIVSAVWMIYIQAMAVTVILISRIILELKLCYKIL